MQRRNTKQRKAILELFQKSHVITAKTITEEYPAMDVSTIYRNLQRMTEDGVIRLLHLQKDIASYELADDEHQHFFCGSCEQAIPFDVQNDLVQQMVPENCTLENVEIQLKGTCGACV